MPRPLQRTNADELTTLCDSLDRQRAAMVNRFSGLTPEQLARSLAPSPLTLAGLIKHLALVEDSWFQDDLLGRRLPEPWASAPWHEDRDWEFNSAVDDTPETLLGLYSVACERSRAAVAELGALDARSVKPTRREKEPFSLRWLLIHMIEETARHRGHADLIRESIDGYTGEPID
jgi:uncharacterized damage-inducible protein DinB